MNSYCQSRVRTVRYPTREVTIGKVSIGGNNRIAVQSMTTTKTEDVEATVQQARELIEAGCEIVRMTAPTMKAARALKEIHSRLRSDGFETPLVADIHFLPKAAMEAVEHVEKVRINPGNFADYKKFKVIEYTDAAYQEELEKLHDAFTPFILRCKELGRAIRIGTNHGSLSDRIMNRFGDTPEGMVQSALEFIRIAESHSFHNIVLSMKASNPKVMIAAYRLAVARMQEEGMNYPLHLGVTEAGDGEDARVKSCTGIGALLADGLGDTLRVSLTEDPVNEVPVGNQLISWAHTQQAEKDEDEESLEESVNYYDSSKRKIRTIECDLLQLKTETPPLVAAGDADSTDHKLLFEKISKLQKAQKDAQIEFWISALKNNESVNEIASLSVELEGILKGIIIDVEHPHLVGPLAQNLSPKLHYIFNVATQDIPEVAAILEVKEIDYTLCADFGASTTSLTEQIQHLSKIEKVRLATCSSKLKTIHGIGSYRKLISELEKSGYPLGIWIRCKNETLTQNPSSFDELLMECSIFAGSLLCEGAGNIISIESQHDLAKTTALSYNILQGARARISKTEFVACPSCGRTLFDLQSTTKKIRSKTNHLKGVTIAIMGCIVNGPGEMADADFGYVGGAPGKVNLYVGKSCVKVGIPEVDAVDALIDLIKEHNKWVDPEV